MTNLLLLLLTIFISACAKDSRYHRDIKAEKVKLCFIGDTGTTSLIQQKVADMLSQEKCHSIHFLGDIIYPHGLKSHKDRQFHEKFMKYYGPISNKDHKPVLYLVMGNHDHRRSINHWITLSRKHREVFFPHPYYLVKTNNVCLVHLDTDYYKLLSNFFVGMAQVNWLGMIDNELKSCGVRIAVTHHPYNNSGAKHGPSSGILRRFQEKHILGRFDYMISGHEHFLADEGIHQGTRLLISGGGGAAHEEKDAGYLVMEVKDNNVVYQFRRLTE